MPFEGRGYRQLGTCVCLELALAVSVSIAQGLSSIRWQPQKAADLTLTILEPGRSLLECAARCQSQSPCGTFCYQRSSGSCYMGAESYASSVQVVGNTSDLTCYGKKWILAFRVSSRVGQSAWDTWNEDGRHDDATVMQNCVDPTSSVPCTSHFRSQILDQWNNIDQVRMSVYKDGVVVAEVTFDGRDSTRTSWLDKSRLMSSTWTDMDRNVLTNFFSVEGQAFVGRRFFLNSYYGGCDGDFGWLLVSDHHPLSGTQLYGQCLWEVYNPGPTILYSASSTAGTLASAAKADFILIHVTYME